MSMYDAGREPEDGPDFGPSVEDIDRGTDDAYEIERDRRDAERDAEIAHRNAEFDQATGFGQ